MSASIWIVKGYDPRQPTDIVAREVRASSKAEAIAALRADHGLEFAGSAEEALKSSDAASNEWIRNVPVLYRVSKRTLQMFTAELAAMVRSGVSPKRALPRMERMTSSVKMRDTMSALIVDLDDGQQLSEAMARHPDVFDERYVTTVQVGEESATLPNALTRLADGIKREIKVRKQIQSALTYPVIVIVTAIVAMFAAVYLVVPGYEELFDEIGAGDLPASTKIVKGISETTRAYWYLFIGGAAVAAYGVRQALLNEELRFRIDRGLLRSRRVGFFFTIAATARFFRALAILHSAGMPMTDAVAYAAHGSGNRYFRDQMLAAREEMTQGISPLLAFERTDVLPMRALGMLATGLESASVPEQIEAVADAFEEDLEAAAESFRQAINPIVLVVVTALVLGLLLALYGPLFAVYDGLGESRG